METKLQVINFAETRRKQDRVSIDGCICRRMQERKGYGMPAAQSIPRTITSFPLLPIALSQFPNHDFQTRIASEPM